MKVREREKKWARFGRKRSRGETNAHTNDGRKKPFLGWGTISLSGHRVVLNRGNGKEERLSWSCWPEVTVTFTAIFSAGKARNGEG